MDFGGVPVLAMRARTLNVHNDGTGPLLVEGAGLGLPFIIRPAYESGHGDDWIIEPGANKAFVLSYLPTEDGWHQATLTMIGDGEGRVVQISGWGASGWRNPVNPFDINGDGYVTPQDVLLLINEINRNGSGTLPPRTAQQPGPPYFFDPNGDGDLTPYDVLQVINFINRGESEQEPPDDGGEGEPGGIDYGWLAALATTSPLIPASMPHSSTIPGLQADQRVAWLATAVDDAAYRTTYRQWGGPFELETWQRLELRRDSDVWEAADSDLPDGEALLDDPAMDLADLDAYFAAMI